jgi:membrane-associated protease RseP (regulator of RpoE activity)
VVPNSPAAGAGLQTGDRIVAVNGSRIDSFGDLTNAVVLSDPDEPLVLDILRDGRLVEPKPVVLPEYKQNVRVRQMGIAPGQNLRVSMPSLRPGQELRLDELHKKDELYKLFVDGRPKEFKDLGAFSRAIVAARGAPVDIIVRRPQNPDALTDQMAITPQPDLEAAEVQVRCSAVWIPAPYDQGDAVSGSLLGLVPRLTVVFPPDPEKSFDRAGLRQGDVIAKIGSIAYPSFQELKDLIEDSAGQELAVEVCRARDDNCGLGPFTVEFCARHCEAFITAARENPAVALQMVSDQAVAADLSQAEREKLLSALSALPDAKAWRTWLENVDVHKLGPLIPKAPFALFARTPPTIDASLSCIGEDHLVVADIKPKLGETDSPAELAGIPRGAVILSVDGVPVGRWWELAAAFRARAGRTVELVYRIADQVMATKMAVPNCITASLNLPMGTRIVKIDGQSSCTIKGPDEKASNIALPDWRAVHGLLHQAVGKTVQVEYVTIDGEKHTADYAVTPDGTDPWLQRNLYSEGFYCYALFERHPIPNPILATAVGFKKAYQATAQTIQSIRHLIFTRQVGFNKISGPVGIIRYGAQIADSGIIDLLWFLAVLSANLAVINFLPMPIVDGGLFLFLLLEKIRGEPVSIKTQVATQIVGIALIAAVFILVTYQDIKNWILGT